jgi:hypothetical protein
MPHPYEERSNTPPTAVCANVTANAGPACTADASIDNGSFDPDGDPITVAQSPAGPYPIGTTLVTLTVTDSHGASSSCTATVTVVDSTAPTLTLNPGITLWPPNHKYHIVTMSQMVQSAGDSCTPGLGINAVVIEKVTSDEPDDAPGCSDGDTTHDIVIASDCRSVQLRAERDERRNGRVYTVTLRVRDASGNETRADFHVSVPISPNRTAVQDAAAVTVTGTCP